VWIGRLRAAGETLELETEDGQTLRVRPDEVESARREVDF